MAETIVVALGGNAILRAKQKGTVAEQQENVRITAEQIARIVHQGYRVVVTHGNGPQVGNILIQQEEASGVVPAMPLDVCGAETQGFIGYLLQQALGRELRKFGEDRPVVTILTQMIVDPADKAFLNPTKPVGPFYTEAKAAKLMTSRGWIMKEVDYRGWRRVVPSPDPKRIVEAPTIRATVDNDTIVIASGGGGVPVKENADGSLSGVEAVIDKDLGAERLAREVSASLLLILTDVEKVAINYHQPDQTWLDTLTVAQARAYQYEGHFREGSMGPKVEAAIRFVSGGGASALITSLNNAAAALAGVTGTRIIP